MNSGSCETFKSDNADLTQYCSSRKLSRLQQIILVGIEDLVRVVLVCEETRHGDNQTVIWVCVCVGGGGVTVCIYQELRESANKGIIRDSASLSCCIT